MSEESRFGRLTSDVFQNVWTVSCPEMEQGAETSRRTTPNPSTPPVVSQ